MLAALEKSHANKGRSHPLSEKGQKSAQARNASREKPQFQTTVVVGKNEDC
jgi:hypothetical protein